MKLLPVALSLAGGCFAAITGVRVSGTTATQAVVTYTAPNTSACSLAVSETVDAKGNPQTPLIHDVDTTLFPGADQDTRPGNTGSGTLRTFVIGKRAAAMGADGRYYSRALEANTTYAGKIVCGADTALFDFKTRMVKLLERVD